MNKRASINHSGFHFRLLDIEKITISKEKDQYALRLKLRCLDCLHVYRAGSDDADLMRKFLDEFDAWSKGKGEVPTQYSLKCPKCYLNLREN